MSDSDTKVPQSIAGAALLARRKARNAILLGACSLYGLVLPVKIYSHDPTGYMLLLIIGALAIGGFINIYILPLTQPQPGRRWKHLFGFGNIINYVSIGAAGYMFGKADKMGIFIPAKFFVSNTSPFILLIPISATMLSTYAMIYTVKAEWKVSEENAQKSFFKSVRMAVSIVFVANLWCSMILCVAVMEG